MAPLPLPLDSELTSTFTITTIGMHFEMFSNFHCGFIFTFKTMNINYKSDEEIVKTASQVKLELPMPALTEIDCLPKLPEHSAAG